MQIDPAVLTEREIYKILTGAVVPRPIAWVATIGEEGTPNLAPFSYFNIACTDPPMLLFCPQRRGDGSPKDTLRNVQTTGEFVLHIVSEELAAAMNQTSAEYPYATDEFAATGLRAAPSSLVAPPRVADAAVAFECRVEQIVHVGSARGGEIVIGRVLQIHVRDDVYHDGYIILDALKPVARLAGNDYARVNDTFSLQRPSKVGP
ncbi:MAG: flavin reductase family protein [Chloroflexi bacterium]|nr:flavin reductase family protein [Chloroflexota bacterium]